MDLLDLRPSMSLKARVALVKKLEPGDTAGYEAAYRAEGGRLDRNRPRGSRGRGCPRVAARGGWVRIGETRYPIVASVSASHTIVEIGPEKTVEAGDVATYFDWRDGSRPEDASAALRRFRLRPRHAPESQATEAARPPERVARPDGTSPATATFGVP